MKTVELFRDFDYSPVPRKTVRFYAGITYTRVIEAASKAIEHAGAGRVIVAPDAAGNYQDASRAFRPHNRKR